MERRGRHCDSKECQAHCFHRGEVGPETLQMAHRVRYPIANGTFGLCCQCLHGSLLNGQLEAWHSLSDRFPGGLKERTARKEFEKDPTSVLRRAVYGMLPKNRLRKVCMQRSRHIIVMLPVRTLCKGTVRTAQQKLGFVATLCDGLHAMLCRSVPGSSEYFLMRSIRLPTTQI